VREGGGERRSGALDSAYCHEHGRPGEGRTVHVHFLARRFGEESLNQPLKGCLVSSTGLAVKIDTRKCRRKRARTGAFPSCVPWAVRLRARPRHTRGRACRSRRARGSSGEAARRATVPSVARTLAPDRRRWRARGRAGSRLPPPPRGSRSSPPRSSAGPPRVAALPRSSPSLPGRSPATPRVARGRVEVLSTRRGTPRLVAVFSRRASRRRPDRAPGPPRARASTTRTPPPCRRRVRFSPPPRPRPRWPG
jgi:hypothetical protein